MKNRVIPITIILVFIVTSIACVVLSMQKVELIDTVTLNNIRVEVESNGHDYSKIDNQGLDFIVIDFDGAVKYSLTDRSDKSYDEWLNFAYQNDCVVLDYSSGKIFVFNPENDLTDRLVLVVALFSTTINILLIIYSIYLNKTIFIPFKRLNTFAGEVAYGNLDSPLLMDKSNAFGAFSESFDIMRLELKKAKDKEIELEKSKKQLVVELSHDIKTPIATIKAVNELLKLNETDAKRLRNIEIIHQKASEIDNLITDMFSVTLQDLSELKINMNTVSSAEIERIIKENDYANKISDVTILDCLVNVDISRLTQIVGNIINNSYKYANTAIEVKSELIDKVLGIEFCDFGGGVSDEELPLITNKFYRGQGTDNKSGAGLGLYICKTILEKMGGGTDCYNTENGFAVKIFLKLA